MLKVFYIHKKSDIPMLLKLKEEFLQLNDLQLIEKYNSIKKLYGAHQQMILVATLNHVFIVRFGKSPFVVTKNILFELGGPIELVGDGWEFV